MHLENCWLISTDRANTSRLLKKNNAARDSRLLGGGSIATSGVAEQVVAWKSTLRALDMLSRTARETAQRVDLLTFSARGDRLGHHLRLGEDDALDQEFRRLSQIDRLSADVQLASQSLDPAEPERVDEAVAFCVAATWLTRRSLLRIRDRSVARADSDQLREAHFSLEDVALGLRRYLDALEADPSEAWAW